MEYKFNHQPKFEIENPDVKKLDFLRVQLNKNKNMLLYQIYGDPDAYVSLETISKIRGLVDRIKREGKKIDKKNIPLFDSLVLQDIKRNVKIVETDHNYFDNPKSRMTLGSWFSGVFGNSAYSDLLDSISPESFPHKKMHKNSELFYSMNSRGLFADIIFNSQDTEFTRVMKDKMISELSKSKEIIDAFYKEIGVTNITPEYKFQFSPSSYGFSFWDNPNLLASIDSDRMFCSKPEGKQEYEFLSWAMHLVGAHELSHAHQDFMSSITMPAGLRTSHETYVPVVHGACGEGTALCLEDFFLDWMQQNREKLKISKGDLEKCLSFRECYVPKKLHQLVYDTLRVKEMQDYFDSKGPEHFKFNARREVANLSGVKRYVLDYNLLDDKEFGADSIPQATYFFGEKRIRGLVNRLQEAKVPEDVVLSSLLTGFWCSPEAQERFILEVYVPRVMAEKNK